MAIAVSVETGLFDQQAAQTTAEDLDPSKIKLVLFYKETLGYFSKEMIDHLEELTDVFCNARDNYEQKIGSGGKYAQELWGHCKAIDQINHKYPMSTFGSPAKDVVNAILERKSARAFGNFNKLRISDYKIPLDIYAGMHRQDTRQIIEELIVVAHAISEVVNSTDPVRKTERLYGFAQDITVLLTVFRGQVRKGNPFFETYTGTNHNRRT